VLWVAAVWEDPIDKNGLEIGNHSGLTHSYTPKKQEGESVIDLTLGTRPIVKWSILAGDHATGSDHQVIE